jgi:hypothetical protein
MSSFNFKSGSALSVAPAVGHGRQLSPQTDMTAGQDPHTEVSGTTQIPLHNNVKLWRVQ